MRTESLLPVFGPGVGKAPPERWIIRATRDGGPRHLEPRGGVGSAATEQFLGAQLRISDGAGECNPAARISSHVPFVGEGPIAPGALEEMSIRGQRIVEM